MCRFSVALIGTPLSLVHRRVGQAVSEPVAGLGGFGMDEQDPAADRDSRDKLYVAERRRLHRVVARTAVSTRPKTM